MKSSAALEAMNLDGKQLQELADDVLARTKAKGADQSEVVYDINVALTIGVRKGEVESVEQSREKGLGISVHFDKHTGYVLLSEWDDQSIDTAIEKACNIARYTSSDPHSGLPDVETLAFDYPDIPLYFPWDISTEDAIEQLLRCEKHAMAQDKRITNSEGASLYKSQHFHFYANSLGFKGYYPSTAYSVSCTLIASEDSGMQRDYDYTSARDPSQLQDLKILAENVALQTVNRLGARSLATRQTPVIFSAQIARSLIGQFVGAISGGAIYRKSSFLVDCLNKPIFPSFINICERPHLPAAIGSAPFDSEGVYTRDQDFVTEGILRSYILSSYSARKLGMKTTGNADGVHNLLITHNDISLKELFKMMGTGLYITEMIGQGVNLVTGDYSRGAFGYWIENGEIQYPVHEITVAGNLKDMFQNIVAIANNVDLRGNIKTGAILIENMMIAGQ